MTLDWTIIILDYGLVLWTQFIFKLLPVSRPELALAYSNLLAGLGGGGGGVKSA